MHYVVSYSSISAYFVCLYRPPGQAANFFGEFKDLLENLATLHSEFYIFGDFNLQLDKHTAVTITFDDILTSFDLKQHVTFSTHIHGHWLGVVITRSTCDNIQIVDVNFSRTLAQSKHNVSYRPIHKIDIDAFKADVLKSDLIKDPKGHLSDLCKQYYHVLKALLNKPPP